MNRRREEDGKNGRGIDEGRKEEIEGERKGGEGKRKGREKERR